MSGQLAVLFGGAGFIGANLAAHLMSRGERVLVFDSLARPGVEQNLRWLQREYGAQLEVMLADVRETDAVLRAVRRATSVHHLAAQVAVTLSLDHPLHDFEVNARGTLNVLEALRSREAPVPFVFTSTSKVYGSLQDLPLLARGARYEPVDAALREHGLGEQRPLDFESPFACSKGAADQYVLDYARTFGLPATVLRLSCIYGPRQFGTEDQGWVSHFLLRARAKRPLTLYGDGKQVRDLLFVDDGVDALVRGRDHIDQLRGQAFNLGGGPARALSLLELLGRLEQLLGRVPEHRFASWRPGDQRYYVSDTRRFQAATGWQPTVGVDDGLRRLHDWLAEVAEPLPSFRWASAEH